MMSPVPSTAIVTVRCHYCSKERNPREILHISGGVAMCWYCYEWHGKAVDLLSTGKPVQECQVPAESLRNSSPDGNVRMYVHAKDGIYQVLCRTCSDRYVTTAVRPSPVTVRLAKPNELEQWAQTCAAGWSEYPEFAHMILDLARIIAAREGGYPFVAEINGQMAATGSLSMEGRVALLAGASTVPAFRRMGAQQALLEARLQFAAAQGCELAMMAAEPGSASQRNSERKGFRIAYARTKWRLGR